MIVRSALAALRLHQSPLARAAFALVAALLAACAPAPPASAPPPQSAGALPAGDPAARAAIDEAEREIAAAAGDCAHACEGVERIARASVALCKPRSLACDDAQQREHEARARVATFCDPCGDER